MLKWQVSHYDVKSLALVEAPIPEPGPRQILVKLGAVLLTIVTSWHWTESSVGIMNFPSSLHQTVPARWPQLEFPCPSMRDVMLSIGLCLAQGFPCI
jgi:hypothetical protein